MLGPSILIASPPFCTGYAYHACQLAEPKPLARAGLFVAGLELLFLLGLFVIGLIGSAGGL